MKADTRILMMSTVIRANLWIDDLRVGARPTLSQERLFYLEDEMYWKITPYHNEDADFCVLPAETEEDNREALKYAQERIEEGWDATAHGSFTVIVKMELCVGPIPTMLFGG